MFIHHWSGWGYGGSTYTRTYKCISHNSSVSPTNVCVLNGVVSGGDGVPKDATTFALIGNLKAGKTYHFSGVDYNNSKPGNLQNVGTIVLMFNQGFMFPKSS